MKLELNVTEEELKLLMSELEFTKNSIVELIERYAKYGKWKHFFDQNKHLHIKQSELNKNEFIKFRTGLICIVYDGYLYNIGHDCSMNINYPDFDDIELFVDFSVKYLDDIIKGIRIQVPEASYQYNRMLQIIESQNFGY